jgi:hypothetical protein
VSRTAKRGWLQRLGLKADEPRPEDWVEVATGQVDSKTGSSYADKMVKRLVRAGIEAHAKPYVLPDDSAFSGSVGAIGPDAETRVRFGVLVRRRDQAQAKELIHPPEFEPVSDEELARQAEEAGLPDDHGGQAD